MRHYYSARRYPRLFRFLIITCITAVMLWLSFIVDGAMNIIGFPIELEDASHFTGLQPAIDAINWIYYITDKFSGINKYYVCLEFLISAISGFFAYLFRN